MALINLAIDNDSDCVINEKFKVPKYKQLANSLIHQIKQAKYNVGDKLPSISKTSVHYLLSRDTVEKAYQLLQRENYIYSISKTGYFVAVKPDKLPVKVCIISGQMSQQVALVYNSLLNQKQSIRPQLFLHHYQKKYLENILSDNLKKGFFDYYIVFPQLQALDEELIHYLQMIPPNKLILLDKKLEGLNKHSVIARNYSQDLFLFFERCKSEFHKYKMCELILPNEYFPTECITVFKLFCETYKFKYRLTDDLEIPLTYDKLYITLANCSLINVVKALEKSDFILGKHIGLLATGETTYVSLFNKRIAYLSYDYKEVANRILDVIAKGNQINITLEPDIYTV